MQEPAPLSVGRVLHTAGVQLLLRNERPALRVALHVQELVYEFRRMQVVHIAALMQARTLQANRSRMIFRIRLSCRTFGVLLHSGVLQVLRCLGEEVELVPELNEVFLLADGTGSFTARYLRATRKGVAAGALAGKLLKGRKVLDHQPLFLRRDRTAAALLQQVQNSLTVLDVACVDLLLNYAWRSLRRRGSRRRRAGTRGDRTR